jgi:hypothetical protein
VHLTHTAVATHSFSLSSFLLVLALALCHGPNTKCFLESSETMNHSYEASTTWKRTLYEKQPYKDTHYDNNEFLNSLHIHKEDVCPVDSLSWRWNVTWYMLQTVSIPFLLVAVHDMLKNDFWSSSQLLVAELLISVVWWSCYLLIKYFLSGHWETEMVKLWSLFFVFFRITAPALRTLTLSISDDTVQAVIIVLFFVHVVFKRVGSTSAHSTGTISLSAAIFAVLMLASRLSHPNSIVIFLLLSIQLLIYIPSLLLDNAKVLSKALLSICLCALTTMATYWVDARWAVVHAVFVVASGVVGPYVFFRMNSSKKLWKGPWDTALVSDGP